MFVPGECVCHFAIVSDCAVCVICVVTYVVVSCLAMNDLLLPSAEACFIGTGKLCTGAS